MKMSFKLALPPEQSKSDEVDTALANSILFIRNAIWWREVCTAVAEGDSGLKFYRHFT